MWDLAVCLTLPPISSVTLKSSVRFYYQCLQSLDELKLARLQVDKALPRRTWGLFCTERNYTSAFPRSFISAEIPVLYYVCTGWENVIRKNRF